VRVTAEGDSGVVYEITGSVVVIIVTGIASIERLQAIQGPVEEMIANGQKPAVFWDFSAATPTTEFRKQITAWHAKVQSQVDTQQILVSSSIVAMAVSAANIFLRGALKAHSSRVAFVLAIEEARKRSSANAGAG
jgi:hypothetical protein